jgi:hypothetical protein
MPVRPCRRISLPAVVLLALLEAGCASNPLTLPPLTSALGADVFPIPPSSDPPVEIYARIARGTLKCWFGPDGSLKATHVFHAKVDSPADGGTAEISVHTRESGTSHGVLRAFGVLIKPVTGGGSTIEVQNVRFPEKDAALMHGDVARWVSGQDGCSVAGAGGWQAGPAPPAADPPKEAVAVKGKDRPPAKR